MGETRTGAEKPDKASEDRERGESLVGRLADVGEEAIRRVYDEIDRSERAHETLQRLSGTRGRLEKLSRSAMRQLGIAPLDEFELLQRRLDRLEKRVRTLEREPSATPHEGADASSKPA